MALLNKVLSGVQRRQKWVTLALGSAIGIESLTLGKKTLLVVGVTLTSVMGILYAIVRVDRPRQIYKQGQKRLRYLMASLSVVGLAFGAIAQLFAERLIQFEHKQLESEKRYSAVIEQSSDGIYLVDVDTKRILEANAAICNLLGYTQEEFLGLTLYDVVPMNREIIDSNTQRLLSEENYLLISDWWNRRKDGSLVNVEVTLNAIAYSGRKVFCAVVGNISSRKEMQAELERSLSLLNATLESTADGILVCDLDAKVKSYNQKFLQMWQLSESFMSWSLQEALVFVASHLKDPESFLSTAKQHQSQPWVETYDLLEFKNGRVFERYSQPQRLGGEIVGRVFSFRDITERKQAEEALRQSEARYRAIVEDQTELLCRFKPDGTLTFVNDAYCRYFDKKPEELIGHPFGPFILHEDREKVAQYIASLSPENPVGTIEERIVLPSGEIRWQQWSDRAIFNEQGNLVEFQSVGRDITDCKQAEESLRKSEATNRTLLNAIPDLMIRITGDGTYLDCIPAQNFKTLIPHTEMRGKNVYDVLPPEIAQQRMYYIEEALSTGKTQSYEYDLTWGDGSVSYEEARIVVSGENEVLVIVRDISDRKQAEATIQYQAFHDLLTGLPNRTMFDRQLSLSLANASNSQHSLAVMFLDMDRFKTINDTLGHVVGDRLLQGFAERVKTCLRESDTVARWGGDEFTVLLPHISTPEDAAKVGQRILYDLKPAFYLEEQGTAQETPPLHISSSIGIALYPQDGEDAETLLRNADAALYRAKEHGRNNYRFYKPEMNAHASALLMLENRLHQALERDEFEVYYQPQVQIDSGDIIGMEALVRWQHPELGLVSPGQFIPLAEENGLIVPIGEWVLRTACAQNKAWQDAGFSPLRVAVNLSPRQFQQPNIVGKVAQALEETGLLAQFLELEITETTIMQNVDFASDILRDLQALGVHISIDDFGTGYSSLSYLKKFSFDKLKIDRSFVRDLTDKPEDTAIISAVITLGRGLNLKVVAEGVETREQLELLRSLQSEEMQGYLFSQPLTAEDATKFLDNPGVRPNINFPLKLYRLRQ